MTWNGWPAPTHSNRPAPPARRRFETPPEPSAGAAESARRERGSERVLDVEAATELELGAGERRGVGHIETDRVRQLLGAPPSVPVRDVEDCERPWLREE